MVFLLLAGPASAQIPSRLPQFPGGSGSRPGGAGSGSTGGNAGGAIIDDTTRMIYGPRTTRYFLESDVLNNRRKLFTLDTLLEGIHQYNYLDRSNNQFTDLGNLGTALRPIFYETPAIGRQTGFNAYAPYGIATQNVRYFDTRSPYTNMYLVLGGRGQNILNFDFTQNIAPRWNVGFNIQRMTSDLQFGENGTTATANQRLVENWNFVAHTNYSSKNKKYTLLFHYNNLNHRSGDQGGIVLTKSDSATSNRFQGTPFLRQANSKEIHNDLHLYHQYVLDTAFQVYHTLDFRGQSYRYNDLNLTQNLDTIAELGRPFYPQVYFDSLETRQTTRFRLFENQFGLKGQFSTGRSAFNYRAWLRQRIYGLTNQFNIGRFLPDSSYRTRRFENFVGGWLGYYFPDSLTRATAELEYLIGRDLRLQGRLESRFLTAGYESVFASPTLLQERFISNNLQWDNDFKLRGTQHAYGLLNLRLGGFRLQPGLDYYLLSNYIYFDEKAVPRQETDAFSILRTGLGWEFRSGKFSLLGQTYYTIVSRENILRIPDLFANARIEYELLLFKKLYVLAGIEVHYRSSYKADMYMPLTQQFHLQNNTTLDRYLMAAPFANFRINRVRLFVKMTNANQDLFGRIYDASPYFPAMRRSLSFGVHWLLFD